MIRSGPAQVTIDNGDGTYSQNRRQFLTGLVATATGVLVPHAVAAEPERRVWALDRTMVQPGGAVDVFSDPSFNEPSHCPLLNAGQTYTMSIRTSDVWGVDPDTWVSYEPIRKFEVHLAIGSAPGQSDIIPWTEVHPGLNTIKPHGLTVEVR